VHLPDEFVVGEGFEVELVIGHWRCSRSPSCRTRFSAPANAHSLLNGKRFGAVR
jgi:hypothetical protein